MACFLTGTEEAPGVDLGGIHFVMLSVMNGLFATVTSLHRFYTGQLRGDCSQRNPLFRSHAFVYTRRTDRKWENHLK